MDDYLKLINQRMEKIKIISRDLHNLNSQISSKDSVKQHIMLCNQYLIELSQIKDLMTIMDFDMKRIKTRLESQIGYIKPILDN